MQEILIICNNIPTIIYLFTRKRWKKWLNVHNKVHEFIQISFKNVPRISENVFKRRSKRMSQQCRQNADFDKNFDDGFLCFFSFHLMHSIAWDCFYPNIFILVALLAHNFRFNIVMTWNGCFWMNKKNT